MVCRVHSNCSLLLLCFVTFIIRGLRASGKVDRIEGVDFLMKPTNHVAYQHSSSYAFSLAADRIEGVVPILQQTNQIAFCLAAFVYPHWLQAGLKASFSKMSQPIRSSLLLFLYIV